MVYQGAIYMFGIENKDNYEKQIESLYVRVEDSDELEGEESGNFHVD